MNRHYKVENKLRRMGKKKTKLRQIFKKIKKMNDMAHDQCIRPKNESTEHSKRNKTVPEKVATTGTEDGHRQTTKTSTTI